MLKMKCFVFYSKIPDVEFQRKRNPIFSNDFTAPTMPIPTENTLDLDSALRKSSPKSKMGTSRLWMLPFPAAALWYNCHVHFNFYVISTLSCQVIFFLLFHIFQCLIHRNTLDSSKIQYHDKQISDQDKQEHFHIAHRAYAKSVPSLQEKSMILQTAFMMTTPKITLTTSITTRTMVVDNRYKLAISRFS